MSAVIQIHAQATGRLPLASGDPDRVLVFGGGAAPVRLGGFLAQAHALAARLPEGRHMVPLVEDRHRFLLAFCAAALRGQSLLLPPSGAPGTVAEILRTHAAAGAYGLGGTPLEPPARHVPLPDLGQAAPCNGVPQVEAAALAAIGYTSGSTGRPQAHAKTWAAFATGTAQNRLALADLWGDAQPQIVATVPPQHMYGMELSVLLPLLGGAAVHAGRPLLPADVARALGEARGPRLLVTTPVHLSALLRSGVALPPLAGLVSATAPLSPELAAQAEARYGGQVREMFGSTETCVFACRRTALESLWRPMPGVRLWPQPDGTQVQAPHLPAPVALADLVEMHEDGRFRLCGRQADLLEIAGKRASLGDLTRRLLAVSGVEDGVVVQLDAERDGDVGRIAALAVAPGLSAADIVAALRGSVDPVFLPRRMRLLPALPRNATGKLRRDALLDLLNDAPAPHSSSIADGGGGAA
ncbi:AMP-ligase [Pseudoxanthomonas broegbernensis]|uniref:AMP-ligase n=1 Tax=Pseudoxanthomonas broegbernensis TaxID=83619 RepID=A0A7V8GLD4_9GAMM|nr:AMP-binding protein [Pseudoxanthomonas broegbernensis]KAF1685711.1 AMP-ligase [Pseudoxanthomonas broegbernensis]MBB6066057.1 acyl-coenzyme A synthetase/AMP-(fatty) acid ligase [Pseudoxanthomonas broegbernensis]